MKIAFLLLFSFLCISTSIGAPGISYKIDPLSEIYGPNKPNPDSKRPKFHGWYIDATKKDISPNIVDQFLRIADSDTSFHQGARAMCFQPGLGFSITREGKKYDYLICIMCSNMNTYVDGKIIHDGTVFTSEARQKIKELYTTIWEKK